MDDELLRKAAGGAGVDVLDHPCRVVRCIVNPRFLAVRCVVGQVDELVRVDGCQVKEKCARFELRQRSVLLVRVETFRGSVVGLEIQDAVHFGVPLHVAAARPGVDVGHAGQAAFRADEVAHHHLSTFQNAVQQNAVAPAVVHAVLKQLAVSVASQGCWSGGHPCHKHGRGRTSVGAVLAVNPITEVQLAADFVVFQDVVDVQVRTCLDQGASLRAIWPAGLGRGDDERGGAVCTVCTVRTVLAIDAIGSWWPHASLISVETVDAVEAVLPVGAVRSVRAIESLRPGQVHLEPNGALADLEAILKGHVEDLVVQFLRALRQ